MELEDREVEESLGQKVILIMGSSDPNHMEFADVLIIYQGRFVPFNPPNKGAVLEGGIRLLYSPHIGSKKMN